MEEAIVSTIQHRRARQAFIERGLAAGERARASGEYHSAESVLAEVDALLDRTP
jgi:predicted transcriptional regulator